MGAINSIHTVGYGTQTTTIAPFTTNANYSWCKMLYTKNEINSAGFSGGYIHGIAFQIGEDTTLGGKPVDYIVNNVKFYIRSKSITSYTSSNDENGVQFPSSPSTLVFSGNLVFNSLGLGWIEIGFSTPFYWDNNSSIEILCKCDDGTWYYGYPYFCYTSTSNCCVYKYGSGVPSNSYGNRTSYRPNIRFAVVNSAPNPANYVYPANNGYAFTVGDTLTWGCGGGFPNKFDVYFGTSSNPPKVVTGQQSMTYALSGLSPGTTYYWKIVPQTANGSASNCPIWSFKTPTSTQLAEGFESYGFPPAGWDNPGGWTQSTKCERIKGGYVALKNVPDSNQYLLITPKLKINSDSYLNFWGFCTQQSSYLQIVYSTDKNNWQQLGSNLSFSYKRTFQYFSISLSSLAGNNYYLGFRTASSSVSYVIDCVFGPEKVPEPPTLVSPANNSTKVSITPTFSWSAASGVTPSGYKVFCDQNNPPTTQIANVTQTSYTLSSPLLYNTTYYWSVLAYTSAAEGEKATAYNFTTIMELPGTPTLISPENNADGVNLKPTLTWNAPTSGGTPAGYKIYFGTSSTPQFLANTTSLSYTFTENLSYNTTYYWTVSAYNDGGEGNKATVRSFTTRTDPTITTFPYMAGNFENHGALPLDWEVAEGVSGSTLHWAVKSGNRPHGPHSAHSGSYYGWLNGFKINNLHNPYYLITPPINLGSTPKQLNYWYWIGTSTVTNPLFVEISSDNQQSWANLYTHSNATNTLNWYQNVINLSDYANSTVYIRFKGMLGNMKGKTDLGLDDIVLEDIPAPPVLSYDFNTIDFGLVNHNVLNGPKYLTIFNTGGGTLSVDNVYISGFNAVEFSLGSIGSISLVNSQSYSIPIYVTPTTVGTLSATLVVVFNSEYYNIALTAEGLPPVVTVIGTEESDYRLPIDPYHNNSYSQTIFLQSEINKANKIDKISYYWDVPTVASTTTNWTIYMGHTTLSSFASSNDWIPIDELTPVFSGEVNLPSTPGWIEINLNAPFSYNNIDNLVIAVNSSGPSIGNDDNYFHCTTYRFRAYRSLACHQDSKGGKGINPEDPPNGELVDGYPNIKMDFKDEQPPLPVELTSFFATISNQNKVNLNWVSQTETDLIGYYVLRGTDKELRNAYVISPLINATNTSQPKAYMYTDNELNMSGTYYYWLQYNNMDGTIGFNGPIEVKYEVNSGSSGDIPLVTSLDNVYPNPFNPIAYIPYTLETKSEVKINIYNTRGQIVKTFDLGSQEKGHHRITWDGRDNDGNLSSNGIYYIVMKAGKESFQRKAVLMK